MKATLPDAAVLARLKEKFSSDPDALDALRALAVAERLLRRSLYEFGSELRGEIEAFLKEPPLLRGQR